MLLLKLRNVDELSKVDLENQIYNSLPSGPEWKVYLAKEIIQIKNNDLETEYINTVELNGVLHHVLTVSFLLLNLY